MFTYVRAHACFPSVSFLLLLQLPYPYSFFLLLPLPSTQANGRAYYMTQHGRTASTGSRLYSHEDADFGFGFYQDAAAAGSDGGYAMISGRGESVYISTNESDRAWLGKNRLSSQKQQNDNGADLYAPITEEDAMPSLYAPLDDQNNDKSLYAPLDNQNNDKSLYAPLDNQNNDKSLYAPLDDQNNDKSLYAPLDDQNNGKYMYAPVEDSKRGRSYEDVISAYSAMGEALRSSSSTDTDNKIGASGARNGKAAGPYAYAETSGVAFSPYALVEGASGAAGHTMLRKQLVKLNVSKDRVKLIKTIGEVS